MIDSLVKIGIICPCNIEYQSCKEILNLHNETELAGRLLSSRKEKEVEVIAVQAGPGKIQCASATQLLIDKFNLNFVFDVGASGSLSDDVNLYDIICVEHSYEYDVCSNKDFENIPEDLKTSTVLNKVFSKEVLKEFSNWARKNMGTTIKVGNIASGEKDVDNKELRQELHNKLDAVVCNWEDNANKEMENDLNANWGKALEIMYKALNKFIFEGWINKINK
jgi:nucleoside phosphorylase